ncbi:LOW QUALITY PROTEIN: hypothetical protein Cgig2_011464 [Carnegiea gigantea]|uniref:Uncharacterized protein n=1 Tax=Carnegiea gigantea TaxID=171969 RepID=A0A9Q1QN40_9CARY|nr:LOW QUALITY PROTEIN: hypothetical protein Cgig2_011464 [Carnegiea gigantea]
MGMEETRRMVSEVTGNDLTMQKFLKYDRRMVMVVEGDADVRIFLKGNDEHRVMGRRGARRRQVHHAKGEREAVSEPEQWAASKFGNERWGRMNNNVIESLNNWMKRIRPMLVSWLMNGHLEKLRKKIDKHKQDILKCKNGVGEIIEQKLAGTYKTMGCIVVMECYSLMLSEYSTRHGNNGKTGRVVGGDGIDDDYDRCILPPTNGRQPGRPPSKRKESQTQGTKSRRCSKCGEVGHTRCTYRNSRADFDANYKSDVVQVEDLSDGSYVPGGSSTRGCIVEFFCHSRRSSSCEMKMVQTSFETVVYAKFCVFNPSRSPTMCTDKRTDVHRGKPCIVIGKPMGN